jgi:hypothetical protein
MYTTNGDNGYTQIMSNMPEWTSDAQTTTADDDVETSRLQSQMIHSFKKVMGKMRIYYVIFGL